MEIMWLYLITFGWTIVGSISLGFGILLGIKCFEFSSRQLKVWEEVKKANLAVGVIFTSIILGVAYVVGCAINAH